LILVGSDRYGSRNIFYSHTDERIVISSEARPIINTSLASVKLNKEAIIEFFGLSFLLGNKTFYNEIRLLPPASLLWHDTTSGRTEIEQYWDFHIARNRATEEPLDTYLRRFDSFMEKAVEIRMRGAREIGIMLSGGLDSRLLAGYAKRVADKTGSKLISFTFGTRNGLQKNIAQKVAEILEIDNQFFEISSDCIANWAEKVVLRGDGLLRIRDTHFVSVLEKVRLKCNTVLVGLFGSELFGEVLAPEILKTHDLKRLDTYFYNRYVIKQNRGDVFKVLSEKLHAESIQVLMKNVSESLHNIELRTLDEIADYWELRQRDRRYIIQLAAYMNWFLDARLPFLDNDIMEFALNLPLKYRIGKQFIHLASQKIFPNLVSIPWEKSGVPPNTTGLKLRIAWLKRVSNHHVKELVERISRGRLVFEPEDYRGYPYWLRKGSRKYIETLLLNSRSDTLNADEVNKVVRDHMMGKRNHDQLICDILNLILLEKNLMKKNSSEMQL